MMSSKLKRLSCMVVAMFCMAGTSLTAYASGGENMTVPSAVESEAETGTSAANEDDADIEVSYGYAIDEDGNLTITIDGLGESENATVKGTVVTGGSRLNVRTGAGLDYEVIDQLRPGEEVTVIGSQGDWYEVIVPEKKGFVHSDYLNVSKGDGQDFELDFEMLLRLMENLGLTADDSKNSEGGKSPLAFTPDGNMSLIDDFLQIEALATEDTEQMEKQFITLQSKNGNTFYLVIDRNGDTENVYFMNLVDEADLMALMEDENGETTSPTCSCTDKCVVGAINTSCEVCGSNMSECTGKEDVSEPEPTEPAEEPEDTKKGSNPMPVLILLLAGGAGGAAYWFKFRKPKTKTSGDSDLDDYDFGEDGEDEEEETELDDADLMAEAESEDEET